MPNKTECSPEEVGLIGRHSASVISRYERGLSVLTLDKLEEVAGVLGYEVEIGDEKEGTNCR